MRAHARYWTAAGAAALLAATAVTACGRGGGTAAGSQVKEKTATGISAAQASTTTPIKHVVVILDENISFDHYFGMYPKAANTDGTPFHAKPGTPKVDGLSTQLQKKNPNLYNPKRLSPDHALTCDQNHAYGPEQKAFHGGKMDRFVEETGKDKCTGQPVQYGEPGLVMDYFDGNTVTGLWNYAQNYSMSDNSYSSVFGPSTPGRIELVSGQTHGVYAADPKTHKKLPPTDFVHSPDADGVGTMIDDPDPTYDDCSNTDHTADGALATLTSTNIGDLLNRKQLTWGWFQGGFRPTGKNGDYAACESSTKNVGGVDQRDYIPHHEPFQYYKSTANEKHLPPSSTAAIGYGDQANHQYDLSDFEAAMKSGNMPSVSFLKAKAAEDAHGGYSDPLDEQKFLTKYINLVQESPHWKDTAVVVMYDDSDGWYDHRNAKITNGSKDSAVDDPALCGKAPIVKGYQDRCGPGPRQPMLVISPYAKVNHVDHTQTEQTSVTRFIEDNWRLGRLGDGSFDARANSITGMFDFRKPHAGKLILDPSTGAPAKQ